MRDKSHTSSSGRTNGASIAMASSCVIIREAGTLVHRFVEEFGINERGVMTVKEVRASMVAVDVVDGPQLFGPNRPHNVR